MKVVRVFADEDVRYGLADQDTITLISDEPFAAYELDGSLALRDARLLAPVVPTKVVAVGLNYRQHAEEMGEQLPERPLIFLKPPTAINGPAGEIRIPEGLDAIDYEGELAVIIGRRTRAVAPEQAGAHILGYACGNDVTARPFQRADGQWTRAKGFDGFCPIGPWVETDLDPSDLGIETYVNGERRQSGRTSDMIFSVPELVSFISHVMTLLPGDVVLTGTPSGIGPMRPGDTVEVRIEGIGSLTNHVGV